MDWTRAGEWINYEGEFGTSSWLSRWNLPEGIVLPQMENVTMEPAIHDLSFPNQQSGGKGIENQLNYIHGYMAWLLEMQERNQGKVLAVYDQGTENDY